jgi:8-oxo-dGTP diphosphatase
MIDVLQRRVVAAILHNDKREVLLQLRDDKPTIPYPNHWTFFGGAVEIGEAPDDAVHREMMEELEISIPLMFWKSYECPARTIAGKVATTNYVYFGQMTRDISTLKLLEGQAMRYFSQAESVGLDLAFMQSPVLAAFFAEKLR